VHTFAGVIGRAGSCQRRPVQVDGQDDE
jgi:hypothetical protein